MMSRPMTPSIRENPHIRDLRREGWLNGRWAGDSADSRAVVADARSATNAEAPPEKHRRSHPDARWHAQAHLEPRPRHHPDHLAAVVRTRFGLTIATLMLAVSEDQAALYAAGRGHRARGADGVRRRQNLKGSRTDTSARGIVTPSRSPRCGRIRESPSSVVDARLAADARAVALRKLAAQHDVYQAHARRPWTAALERGQQTERSGTTGADKDAFPGPDQRGRVSRSRDAITPRVRR